MKNLLRLLMLVVIVVAVFFASDFLINQNENYDLKEPTNVDMPTNVEETLQPDISGEELIEDLIESGEIILSGEVEIFSGEVLESGEIVEIPLEVEEIIPESGDIVVSNEEVVNY